MIILLELKLCIVLFRVVVEVVLVVVVVVVVVVVAVVVVVVVIILKFKLNQWIILTYMLLSPGYHILPTFPCPLS